MKAHGLSLFAVFTALAFTAAGAAAQTEWSGSFSARSGLLFPRQSIPDEAMQDWYSRIAGTVRLRGGQGAGRFSCEAWGQLDPALGSWSSSLDEAWGQWSPLGWMSFRLGRSRLSFGPCLAFSPANSFQSRDPFDLRASKLGLDGLQTELRPLEAIWPNIPLGFSMQADLVLPPQTTLTPSLLPLALPDLEEIGGRARLVFVIPEFWILAQTELGCSGELRDLGLKARRWASGCWLSADIAGFVLAAEGGYRSAGYGQELPPTGGEKEIETAFGLSRKFSDLFFLAEGRWYSVTEAWQCFGKLAYAHEDFAVSCSILADFKAEAARTGFDLSWNASDELVVAASLAWNHKPENWKESGPLAADASVSLSAEWYF
jgi:hypothetical protein